MTAPARAAVGDLDRITRATDQAGARMVAYGRNGAEAMAARRQAMAGEALGIAATGFALYQAVQPAIQYERALKGVEKVVGLDPSGIERLTRGILELTTTDGLPMSAEEIAAIVEAAGQAGVVDSALPDDEEARQLLEFAKAAAQMGVAFDMSAAQAGASMSTWRARLKMTQPEVMALGDMVNHLSNNTAAAAPGIVDIINRQGALAIASGLSHSELAALSATFLSTAGSAEIGATAMKNFLGPLTSGEALTKRKAGVLKRLGIDATDLAQRMQVDAKGAIMDLMAALARLPEYEQAGALKQLFGEESVGAIAPLLTNLGLLEKTFGLVADGSAYSGSMLEEYQVQAQTTANAIQITANFVNRTATVIGTVFLPAINDLLAMLQPMIAAVTAWAEANPELVRTIGMVIVALLALRIASIALRFLFFGLAGSVFRVIQVLGYLTRGLGFVLRAFRGGTRGARAFGRAFRALSFLSPLNWARLILPFAWSSRWIKRIPWRRLAGVLPWGRLIAPFVWSARWIVRVPWLRLAGRLAWSLLVSPLKWAALIGPIGWAALAITTIGLFAWHHLGLKELIWDDWLSKIDWRAKAAEWGAFTWADLGLFLIPWSEFIVAVPWEDWFGFSWSDVLPKWVWSEVIPSLNLRERLGLDGGPAIEPDVRGATDTFASGETVPRQAIDYPFNPHSQDYATTLRTFGGRAPVADGAFPVAPIRVPDPMVRVARPTVRPVVLPTTPGPSTLGAQGGAAREGQPIAVAPVSRPILRPAPIPPSIAALPPRPVLASPVIAPSPAQVASEASLSAVVELAGFREHLQTEIAALQARIDGISSGPHAGASLAPMEGQMSRLTAELAGVEEELVAAIAETGVLTTDLGALDGMSVRPVIDAATIDAALERVRLVRAELTALKAAGQASGQPIQSQPRAAGGRDTGGAVAVGQLYRIAERGIELFQPNVPGTVHPTRVVNLLQRAGQRFAELTSPPARTTSSTSVQRGGDTNVFHIHAAPGQDPRSVADAVLERLDRRARRKMRGGALHDGEGFA
ncbi:MAG: phage tail tape measure protein [Shimia sp.]